MHEYSIVSALLDRVEEEAARRGASSVDKIHLRIGELSGVEVELLRSAYELCRERGPCSGAELEVTRSPARWSCPRCETGIAAGAVLRCPRCAVPARLASGDEILLERIEMEVP